MQTLKESVVTSIDGGKEEVWYYSPVTSLEEMIYAIESGDAVELESDIELNNVALVLENVYTTINLNDKKIIGGVFAESNGDMLEGNSDSYAIWVKNGSEVDIKGDGEVVAQDASYSMAVWADGGVVNIYGGTYKNGGDGCDLIYAKNGGVVNIYGGTFIATKNTGKEPATTNEYSALNIHNTSPGKINVYGGSFYKFNPENNDDTNRFGSFVVEGYKVVLEGDYYNVVKE